MCLQVPSDFLQVSFRDSGDALFTVVAPSEMGTCPMSKEVCARLEKALKVGRSESKTRV
jgi:hypothetical protein